MIAPIKQRLGLSTPLTLSQREAVQGLIYISPWIIGFLVFTVGPMIASAYLSLTNYNMVTPPRFAGLNNYEYMFSDRLFLEIYREYTLLHHHLCTHRHCRFAGIGHTAQSKDRGQGRFTDAVFSAIGHAGGGGCLPLALDLPAADRADEQHHIGAGTWQWSALAESSRFIQAGADHH